MGTWKFVKHTQNFFGIFDFAKDLALVRDNINHDSQLLLRDFLKNQDLYEPRNRIEKKIDTINHRINFLKFFLFGHTVEIYDRVRKNRTRKFLFSPLGNLLLDYYDRHDSETYSLDISKIFLAMLFGIQYPNQGITADSGVALYPFRLIFKLLRDSRLDGKLYNREIEDVLMNIDACSSMTAYNKIVQEVLKIRSEDIQKTAKAFHRNEAFYVNLVYQWQYYCANVLKTANVVTIEETEKPFATLYHPAKPGTVHRTKRFVKNSSISLSERLIDLCDSLLAAYEPWDSPIMLESSNRLYEDSLKLIYGFFPSELLESLGEKNEFEDIENLTNMIKELSRNEEHGDAYRFEDVLCTCVDKFKYVKASKRGGAGHTDIECLYERGNDRFKFDIEAKSRHGSLESLELQRIQRHREEVHSSLTLIVTPKYLPGVLLDIEKDKQSVIVLASTLAEYIFNSIKYGDSDFYPIIEIARQNPGTDISEEISRYTAAKFGAAC